LLGVAILILLQSTLLARADEVIERAGLPRRVHGARSGLTAAGGG
jgi:hypothetical protein